MEGSSSRRILLRRGVRKLSLSLRVDWGDLANSRQSELRRGFPSRVHEWPSSRRSESWNDVRISTHPIQEHGAKVMDPGSSNADHLDQHKSRRTSMSDQIERRDF